MLFTPWLRSLKFSSRRTRTAQRHQRRFNHLCGIESLEDRTLLSVFTVNSTADMADATPLGDGVVDVDLVTPGNQVTLRGAIQESNNLAGADAVHFNIGAGGVQTIQPLSALPDITDVVTIDGSTQPGYTDSPIIEIDASNVSEAHVFKITGGDSLIRALVMNRAPGGSNMTMIHLSSSGNTIQGSYIGTDVTGTVGVGGSNGLFADYSNNVIGTDGDGVNDAAEGNLISGNLVGVNIRGTGNTVAGNLIGTDVTGTIAIANIRGMAIDRGSSNHIGTNGDGVSDALERNVISGNDDRGVRSFRGAFNVFAGNYIGVDVTGTQALPNGGPGLEFVNSTNNLIGTDGDGVADAAERNVISANAGRGVSIGLGSGNNVVAGNYIGTDVTGTIALGNVGGVLIGGSSNNNLIGTDGDGVADAAERNVISGNINAGIAITHSTGNVVAGNYIGPDATGLAAFGHIARGNQFNETGILIQDAASDNRIGTNGDGVADDAERNVISGNGRWGMFFNGGNGTGHLIAGNYIGPDATGMAPLGNEQLYGIQVAENSGLMQFGGSAALANTIAFNGLTGVRVFQNGTSSVIRTNSIHSNGGLGIDVIGNGDGVTLNDSGDADGIQNFPVLNSVTSDTTSTTISGTLNSTASSTFTLEFFSNSLPDASGFGEGETFLGWTTVTTDATGNVSFMATLGSPIPAGSSVTATATKTGSGLGTSEFSANFIIVNVTPSIISAAAVNSVENQTSVIDVQSSDPDGETENGGGLTYSLTGGADQTLFSIDTNTGVLTFNAAPDFENPSDAGSNNVYDVQVTVTDAGGLTDAQDISVNVLNQASITGVVFVDVDQDGEYDANEPGIDGVAIELLDASGTSVLDTVFSSDGGLYLFEDLDAATYQLREIQPTGVDDGAESLGSLGGLIVANDTMQLTLNRTDASDYAFAELGQDVSSGDTATIGFWQNKHGQALINAGGAGLANWLSTTFTNVFGNVFTNTSVADFYKQELFKQKAQKSAGPAKVDAQFMATAMATYFTSSNLAGNVATAYGFNVTNTGIGTKVVSVGTSGAAFSVADGTNLTIMQLLLATNGLTDQPDSLTGAASIYDTNGDGIIDASEAALRAMANGIYTSINEGGGF